MCQLKQLARLFILCFLTIGVNQAFATDMSKPIEKPKECKPVCKEPWKVTLAPYLWGISLNGSVNVGTRGVAVNETFSDLLQDFQGGGMLWIDVNKGKWDIFLNSIYAYLSRISQVGRFQVKPVIQFGLFTAGVSYDIYNKNFRNCTRLEVWPYIGVRYTLNDTQIKIVNTVIQAGSNQQWADPIIGSKFNYVFNPRWKMLLAGDIGGTGANQKSYNLNGYIGYTPVTKCVDLTIYGGYRYLYQKYINNKNSPRQYVWKMHIFGPVVGLAFLL